VIRQAHCCCPLPGDPIVGLLNPNKGIIVHRSDCRTLRRYRVYESERLLEINWLALEPQRYRAPIVIVAHDRAGLLRDVAAVVADAGIKRQKLLQQGKPDHVCMITHSSFAASFEACANRSI
jgi:GTP diphosphokinase / guanosine-3',5'-bis(diphosphate) 3'-diphosphatase